MSIYVYNSDLAPTSTYTTEDLGSITSSVDSSVDYNFGSESLPVQNVPDYSTSNYVQNFSSNTITFDSTLFTFDNVNYEDFGYIWETPEYATTPFGSISIQPLSVDITPIYSPDTGGTILVTSTLTENVVFVWAGNGTIFEIANGLERTVNPYVASGTLRIGAAAAATALESVTYAYNESSIYGSLLDYGTVAGPAAPLRSLDYGSITQPLDLYFGSEDFGLISESPTLIYPFVPGIFINGGATSLRFTANTPENTILYTFSSGISSERKTKSYNGVGTLQLSGTGLEAYSAQTPENTILYNFSGTGLEAYSAQTPENTVLYTFSSGISSENTTKSYNDASGTLQLSGSVSEVKRTNAYNGSGTINVDVYATEVYFNVAIFAETALFAISGSGEESYSAQTPENTQLFVISNDDTPTTISRTSPYIGIGTPGIQFVPGVGYFPDAAGNLRDALTYSNRYPINDKQATVGIVTISGTARARVFSLVPFSATGKIVISGDGSQSITPAGYRGSGKTTISGISSNRKISNYGYYGDERNPGTSGTIFISQQTSPTIIKNVDAYSGNGQLSISGISTTILLKSFRGSGSISIGSSSIVSYSANTPENTILYVLSGSSTESYSAQTPEDTVLYTFSGVASERTTKSYESSGSILVSGATEVSYSAAPPATGRIRFVSRTVDNDYDTCDNIEVTCDIQNSADVAFVANPTENTQLFVIYGNAVTSELATYTFTGIGTHYISGGYSNLKFTSGAGESTPLFNFYGSSSNVEVDAYKGSGSLFFIGGSTQSRNIKAPNNTILYNIFGTGVTKVEKVFTNVGIGLFTISNSASTRKISVYSKSGIGSINLFGQVLDPDVKFIPAPKGVGTFNIVGSASDSISRQISGNGSFFTISSGKQSFTYSTYVGLGTIYTISVSSSTINNPFQIPRTYTIII